MSRSRSQAALWGACLAFGLALVAAPRTGDANIEGVSYTLSPTVEFVRWDQDLGLENTQLYGGRLGLNFGRFMALEGFYGRQDGVETRLGDLGLLDAGGQPLVNQQVDLRSYGANLVLNLGTRDVSPFIRLGSGVARFEADDGEDASQIQLKVGGGVRFGVAHFQGTVFVEDSILRMDRYAFAANDAADPPFPADPERNDSRHNLTVGVGLDFKLGGYDERNLTPTDRAIANRYRAGFAGMSIPIEPFVGRLDFAEDLGLSNHDLIGLRTGLDPSP